MAYPLRPVSDLFSNDHRHNFEAVYFDTTSTAVRVGESHSLLERDTAIGTGVKMALFDLLDTTIDPLTTTRASLELAMQNNSGRAVSILGYNIDNTPRTGVVPNIYMYWGAGAPPGAGRAKQVLMKFTGVIPATISNVTLVACGQGSVQIYRNGTALTELSGSIREPIARTSRAGLTFPKIKSEMGYVFNSTPITLTAGDSIEIYYWHNGENWGGFGLKAIVGTMTPTTFLPMLRDAAVVGTSFLPASATPITGVALPYLLDAQLDVSREQIPQLKLTVPITTTDQIHGYRISANQGVKILRDNANLSLGIQRGRLLHFRGGTQLVNGTTDMYPRYLWVVRDIEQTSQNDAQIVCEGITCRLADQFDENYPDYLDYHMAGYVLREGSTEPVFGVPALDNWPLEIAMAVLCYRAGIDAMSMGYQVRATQTAGKRIYRTQDNTITHYGIRQWRARALATGKHIPLERQSNYGNVPPLASDNLPADDPYLFKPEITKRLYDRAMEIASQFGYDFGETPDGFLMLRARNNPTAWQPMTGAGPYATYATTGQIISISSVGGPVFSRVTADGAWTKQFEGVFSRIDLYAGVGVNAGSGLNGGYINVLVERKDGTGTFQTVRSFQVSTYLDLPESYYYDDAVRSDGTNAAVIKLGTYQPDYYRVTLTPGGPVSGVACAYRLNGVAVYEYDPEASLFTGPQTQQTLTTLGNIFSIKPTSMAKEQINYVVAVGARKATVSDSAKFQYEANNPATEFSVAVGADPFSIYDPTAPNFVGSKRMTVIFDEKIADTSFAYWLVRTILYRYQSPAKDAASFDHTAIPVLEPGDAVVVTEAKHQSVNHTLFVSSISERYSLTESTSSIDAKPFPALPSYQPREDLDIDTLYVDPVTGKGLPVINVAVTYNNIYNRTIGNTSLSNPDAVRNFAARGPTSAATLVASLTGTSGTFTPSAPVCPESMYLSQYVSSVNPFPGIGDAGQVMSRALVNNPYRQFFRISSWSGSRIPTITFDFQEGDGTAGLYDTTYYNFPGTNWFLNYDPIIQRTVASVQVENPFYDPYTSELGNLVQVSFDQLVAGRVRVSMWAKSDSSSVDIPVAWLTNPTADVEKPEAHYVYMDAGAGRTFLWDGTDTIGLWNIMNSQQWSEQIKGEFGDKAVTVGKGFYAWNDVTTNTHTYIGDLNLHGGSYPNFDANNAPHFTLGQYAKFYVKIEVLNDDLVAKDMDPSRGLYEPRTVSTMRLVTSNGWNSAAQAYVFTHLGEPTQTAIRIQDYIGAGWTPGATTSSGDWTSGYSSPDQADASFWVGKPVRITFVPRNRRGIMWAGNSTKTSVKLTRQVHLKTMTFDQRVTTDARPWNGNKDPKVIQPLPTVGKRTVTSRMFHNEDHTVEFEDSEYRTGSALTAFEWIFDPSQFKKDFGSGQVEALRFGDYDQLESLPEFNANQLGGTSVQTRSAMLMAFMTYLFYFSAATIDRSGRRQWCINSYMNGANKQGFVDKGKIVTPTWLAASGDPASGSYRAPSIIDYEERGADQYLIRSIFVRQWKESYWSNPADSRSPAHSSKFNITDTFQRLWLSVPIKQFDLEDAVIPTAGTVTNQDTWLAQWNIANSNASYRIFARASVASVNPLAGKAYTQPFLGFDYVRPTAFGTWTFDRTGFTNFFQPSPKRDFHPYRRYPYVPDTSYLIPSYDDAGMQLLSTTGGASRDRHRDPAAKQDWYGHAWSVASGNYAWGPMLEVSVEEASADGRDKLRANTANRLDFVTTAAQYVNLFDYVRSDWTNRWDQFRGVVSRAPYASRNYEANASQDRWDVTWTNAQFLKSADTQPVKASGVYLLNAFRYSNYINAPSTNNQKNWTQIRHHWTDRMYQFWDYRFHHEYVWYSAKYFPVTRLGSPIYMYTRNEYTRLRDAIAFPWVNEANTAPVVYYDPGAWTGWKPDIPLTTTVGYATAWTGTDRYLRWREVRTYKSRNTSNELLAPDMWLTLTGGEVGMAGSGRVTVTRDDHGQIPVSGLYATPQKIHKRTNIFDEYGVYPVGPRLAVGPESPEARNVTMHLTLSNTYRGT